MSKATKRIVIPVIILTLLVAAVLLTANPFTAEKKAAEKLAADSALVSFCDFGEGVISKLEVTPPGGAPFHFIKENEEWFVAQDAAKYHTNQTKLDNLLNAVAGLRSTAIATDKPTEHATYELEDATAYGLKVYTGSDTPAADLLIGKAAAGTNFARLPGKNEVYRLNNNVKIQVAFAFQDYRSKQPWAFDPLLVEGVHLRAMPDPEGEEFLPNIGEEKQVINSVNSLWESKDGRGVDQNKLTELLQKLSKLSVNSFADDASTEAAGLVAMEPQIVVVTPQGEQSLTLGGVNDSAQFYVKDQDGLVYTISKYNVNFLTDLGDLSGLFFEPVDPSEHEVNENIAEDLPVDIAE